MSAVRPAAALLIPNIAKALLGMCCWSLAQALGILVAVLLATSCASTARGEGEGEGDAGEGEGDAGEGEGEGEGEAAEGEGEGDPPPPPPPPPPLDVASVLLVGNSQLGVPENYTDLHLALEELFDLMSGPGSLAVDHVQVFGQDCGGFLANAGGDVDSGDYDLVVLVPAIVEDFSGPPSECWEEFYQRATAAGSRFGVLQTATLPSLYPSGFDEMDTSLASFAASHNDIVYFPAGAAWRTALGEAPSNRDRNELYSSDGAHPGAEGMYLYVLALYRGITGSTVVGLPRDLTELRCAGFAPSCPALSELDACAANDSCGDVARDGNDDPTVITTDEALSYQQAIDATLSR